MTALLVGFGAGFMVSMQLGRLVDPTYAARTDS